MSKNVSSVRKTIPVYPVAISLPACLPLLCFFELHPQHIAFSYLIITHHFPSACLFATAVSYGEWLLADHGDERSEPTVAPPGKKNGWHCLPLGRRNDDVVWWSNQSTRRLKYTEDTETLTNHWTHVTLHQADFLGLFSALYLEELVLSLMLCYHCLEILQKLWTRDLCFFGFFVCFGFWCVCFFALGAPTYRAGLTQHWGDSPVLRHPIYSWNGVFINVYWFGGWNNVWFALCLFQFLN